MSVRTELEALRRELHTLRGGEPVTLVVEFEADAPSETVVSTAGGMTLVYRGVTERAEAVTA